MSEKTEQAESSAAEPTPKPEDQNCCGPQMQQMMTKMMKACGCCAEMVGSVKNESGTHPSTCC